MNPQPTYTLSPAQELAATHYFGKKKGTVISQSSTTCNCVAHNWRCRWDITYLTEGAIILEHQAPSNVPPLHPMVPRVTPQALTQAQWNALTYKVDVNPHFIVLWKLSVPPPLVGSSIPAGVMVEMMKGWLFRDAWADIPGKATLQVPGHIVVRCKGCNEYEQIKNLVQWTRHRDECMGIAKQMALFVMERWEKGLL